MNRCASESAAQHRDVVAALGETAGENLGEALDTAHVRPEVGAHEENSHAVAGRTLTAVG